MIHWSKVKVWHVDTEELQGPEVTRTTLAKYRAGEDTGRMVLADPKDYPGAVSIYDEPGVGDIDWEGF